MALFGSVTAGGRHELGLWKKDEARTRRAKERKRIRESEK
jgi:hypothetical protein